MKTASEGIPPWVKLGAAGFGTVVLARWAPTGIDVVLIISGALMMLGALIWARIWVTGLVPRGALVRATGLDVHKANDSEDFGTSDPGLPPWLGRS